MKLQSICCRILFAIGCRTAGFSLLSPTAGIFAVGSDAYADAENKGALFLLSPDDPVCQPNMSHDPLVVSLTPLNCFRAKLQIHTRSSETFAEGAQPQDESCGREGNCQGEGLRPGQAETEGEVQECTQHCDRTSLSVPASVAPSAAPAEVVSVDAINYQPPEQGLGSQEMSQNFGNKRRQRIFQSISMPREPGTWGDGPGPRHSGRG